MQIVNKRREGEYPYIAGLNGMQVGLYAYTLAEAKQRAIEHFKPNKKNRGLLWVRLAEED